MTLIPNLGLSAEAIEERIDYGNASEAPALMSGKPEKLRDLFLFHTRQKPPDDLSRNLRVLFGLVTEPLSRHEYTKATGIRVTDAGKVCFHPVHKFLRCTLDGLTDKPAVYEAKCVFGQDRVAEAAQFYMPQIQQQMACADLRHGIFGIFEVNNWGPTYNIVPAERDDFYVAELVDRWRWFWGYVERREMPPGLEPVAPPEPPTTYRTVDMRTSNSWSDWAALWCRTLGDAGSNARAAKELRAMVEADVGHAFGHGVEIKRKGGKLYLTEAEE